MSQQPYRWSRREFVRGVAVAGSAGLLGFAPRPATAEPPPETTRLRIGRGPSLCQAPQLLVEELLKIEGFTDLQIVQRDVASTSKLIAAGKTDVDSHFAGPLVIELDAGQPMVLLAGVHVGCFELFGTQRVRAVHDLKGKTVAVTELGLTQHVFLASMVAHVGLDPQKDVNFVAYPAAQAKQLLADGKVDAYLGFPPDPQELRDKKIGHVVVNSSVDRPWSQYFCCFLIANREFAQRHPVATKRAVRAILKATDMCAREPDRAARTLVDKGFTQRYDYAFQAVNGIPYDKWRVYNPDDTLRFYALRLHEAGMIKSSPQKILAQGTDWRFLNELKKELKA
ncbi:MAG TPA: ABC transporter substrate-binding protein [Methylomirabilota bacterium]|nr:ABC transporter substrate-binding protein [Methylomirabilota bacterium]